MRRHKSLSPSVSNCSSVTEGKEAREKPRAELALELDPPGPVIRAMLLEGGALLSVALCEVLVFTPVSLEQFGLHLRCALVVVLKARPNLMGFLITLDA